MLYYDCVTLFAFASNFGALWPKSRQDTICSASSGFTVIHGASWLDSKVEVVQTSFRGKRPPNIRESVTGVRLVVGSAVK